MKGILIAAGLAGLISSVIIFSAGKSLDLQIVSMLFLILVAILNKQKGE